MRAASGRQVAISTSISRLLMVWAPHHTVLPHYKTVNICPNTDIAHAIVRPWDWSMVYLWWVHGVVYSLSLELQHCTLTGSITDNSIRILDFVRYNLFIFVQCYYYEITIDCINHIPLEYPMNFDIKAICSITIKRTLSTCLHRHCANILTNGTRWF